MPLLLFDDSTNKVYNEIKYYLVACLRLAPSSISEGRTSAPCSSDPAGSYKQGTQLIIHYFAILVFCFNYKYTVREI